MNNRILSLDWDWKNNVLIVNAVFRALTEYQMKMLRRIKLHKEGVKSYRMYPKRREAIKQMERIAVGAVTDFFLSLPGVAVQATFLDIAGEILYSEDILVLWRVDWRTYQTKNDFSNKIKKDEPIEDGE